MAFNMLARPLRRRATAAVVAVLAVGGATMMTVGPAQAAEVGACTYTSQEPYLNPGTNGSLAVAQAQCEINYAYAYGHSTNYGNGSYNGLTVDGNFGNNTLAALRNFQIHCMHASNPVGGIGPNTWGALDRQVQSGHFC